GAGEFRSEALLSPGLTRRALTLPRYRPPDSHSRVNEPMQFETWLIFLATSAGLSLSPGPNGLLALTHGAMHGSRKTSFTILGSALGFVLIIALCMFGIGALIQSSVHWLTALKWLGGLYLVWLGVQVWRSPAISVAVSERIEAKGWLLFRQGLLSAATNPKCLLFFSAF